MDLFKKATALLSIDRTRTYPRELPDQIRPWYCFADRGHSVVATLPQFLDGTDDLSQVLFPIPVRSVLRGWEEKQGVIVATSDLLNYDNLFGLECPDEDEEF